MAAAITISLGESAAAGTSVRVHEAYAQQCPDSQYPATRDPANPLDLATPPGPDPLHGAHLFVDGPRHGYAAGAIAALMGLDPTGFADSYSWDQFKLDHPLRGRNKRLLQKIADQQETENFSLYAGGGGPGAVYAQVQKLLCHNLTADHAPHTVPVFSTFFVYPNGQFCPTLGQILGNWRTFKRQIDELAAATGRHPAVFLLEIDAVGASGCLSPAALRAWESDLRYEIEQMTALPHTVVYIEGGAADEATPRYVANVLDAICVVKIRGVSVNVCAQLRGIFTNGTHFDWTSNEVKYGTKISHDLGALILQQTHQPYTSYLVVNTAQNGRGPKLNPHPVTQGIEDTCNPPGRGLGPRPSAETGFPLADAWLWTGVPGRSHNSSCHPGDAPAGVFFVRFALELAANADGKLGPGYPDAPY